MKRTPYPFADFLSRKPPPKGWDCADACDDGWTFEQLEEFLRITTREPEPPLADDPELTKGKGGRGNGQ